MAASLVSTGTCVTSGGPRNVLRRESVASKFHQSSGAPRRVASSVIAVQAGHRENGEAAISIGRREATAAGAAALLWSLASPQAARADFIEDYKKETSEVIEKVRETLNLDKNDPKKGDSVLNLREASNVWVAKYRREKAVAGKPSFSNMYSALNAISGHYISFGAGYPFPKKRADRILEEVSDAERQLARGR